LRASRASPLCGWRTTTSANSRFEPHNGLRHIDEGKHVKKFTDIPILRELIAAQTRRAPAAEPDTPHL
jgi:hypothetical protein